MADLGVFNGTYNGKDYLPICAGDPSVMKVGGLLVETKLFVVNTAVGADSIVSNTFILNTGRWDYAGAYVRTSAAESQNITVSLQGFFRLADGPPAVPAVDTQLVWDLVSGAASYDTYVGAVALKTIPASYYRLHVAAAGALGGGKTLTVVMLLYRDTGPVRRIHTGTLDVLASV